MWYGLAWCYCVAFSDMKIWGQKIPVRIQQCSSPVLDALFSQVNCALHCDCYVAWNVCCSKQRCHEHKRNKESKKTRSWK